jgi:GntR family transcriptional regulator
MLEQPGGGCRDAQTGPHSGPMVGARSYYRDVTSIRVSQTSGVPIYKQIVEQIEFMIEAGQLTDGDRLPSSRMLAKNLSINRNTVARAYRDLREQDYVESQRRRGMVVVGAVKAQERAKARTRARTVLADATKECVSLGLSAEEISSLAYHFGLHAEQLEVKIGFVECNIDRANYFSEELSSRLELEVEPLVLEHFDPDEAFQVDLILTTFFHLTEVRRLARGRGVEVVAIVVAPHVRTLVQLAQVPKSQAVGILYSTQDQAEGIRDSLVQTGLENIHVLSRENLDEELKSVDVVVVPTEMPQLVEAVDGKVQIIDFGNILDEASLRMVQEVVDEIQDRKALAGTTPAAD